MFKKISLVALAAMAFSFADETYIRNICDSLPTSKTPQVNLKLAYIEETLWYGSKDFKEADSVKTVRHKDFNSVKPLFAGANLKIQDSITATCSALSGLDYRFGEWSSSKKAWGSVLETGYSSLIMDVNINQLPGLDPSNSYNVLAIRKGEFPDELSFSSKELMVSRTFEFNFETWNALALYKENVPDGDKVIINTYTAMSNRLDSAEVVAAVIKALDIPDTVSKVQVQVLRSVLMDVNKIEIESSSSEAEESSSSEESTAIGRVEMAPRIFGESREIRRLDGSRVKAGEPLVPGVYYVKGLDGRWKKQIELPR